MFLICNTSLVRLLQHFAPPASCCNKHVCLLQCSPFPQQVIATCPSSATRLSFACTSLPQQAVAIQCSLIQLQPHCPLQHTPSSRPFPLQHVPHVASFSSRLLQHVPHLVTTRLNHLSCAMLYDYKQCTDMSIEIIICKICGHVNIAAVELEKKTYLVIGTNSPCEI